MICKRLSLLGAILGIGLAPPAAFGGASHGKKTEIGAVSRATGHLFREGLTADFQTGTSPQTVRANADGLLSEAAQGAFATELWQGMTKGDIDALLSPLFAAPSFPASLPLARRILLTDAELPDSPELQALRLEKMTAFGAWDEAARLYSHWSPESPDSRLLTAAARALILSGQPAVACLETKASRAIIANTGKLTPERKDLLDFCTYMPVRDMPKNLAGPPPSTKKSEKTALFGPFQPEKKPPVNKPDLFRAATPVFFPVNLSELVELGPILIATAPYLQGISYTRLSSWALPDNLPPEVATILTNLDSLPLGLRLKLFAQSSGTVAPTPSLIPSGAPALPAGNPDEIWDFVAHLYTEQWQGAAKDAPARTHAILALFPHLPLKMQTLFVPTFESLPASLSLKPEEETTILRAFLAINAPQSKEWVARITARLQKDPSTEIHDPALSALLLIATLRGYTSENMKIPFSFSKAHADGQTNLLKMFKNLSDLLDNPPAFIDNPPEVYEKSSGLTQVNHYVIPVQVLRKHLRDAQDQGQIGRMLLTSLLLLQNQEPRDFDPDLLAKMLDGLIALGLKEEARQIATTVLIGVTTKGD